MPIRKSERARYPKDWKAISARIRERDHNRCMCTGQCGANHSRSRPGGTHTIRGGRYACEAYNSHTIARYRECPEDYLTADLFESGEYDLDELLAPIRVVLTVAHLDHNPENNDDGNLLAMCQRCHLMLDREQHAANARETRRGRKATGDLFDTTRAR